MIEKDADQHFESKMQTGGNMLRELFPEPVEETILIVIADMLYNDFDFSLRNSRHVLAIAFGGEEVDYVQIVDKVVPYQFESSELKSDILARFEETRFGKWAAKE